MNREINYKIRAFYENARLLRDSLGIVPLLYGSLGLEYLTGENLNADDVDILIPGCFVTDQWAEFRAVLEQDGYTLTDAHEHEFEKDGIHFAYAGIEDLESFAGIPMAEIGTREEAQVSFRLLSLQQYLRVYTASSKDGYRANVKEKKDMEKIALIERCLRQEELV